MLPPSIDLFEYTIRDPGAGRVKRLQTRRDSPVNDSSGLRALGLGKLRRGLLGTLVGLAARALGLG